MRRAALLPLGLLVAGCVSAFPEEALRSVDRGVTLAEVRRAPGAHVNQRVLLGGEILATRPRPGETEIEVLGRRLRANDSPEVSDRTDGRFLVRTAEFLDPAVYAAGRRITVLGTVAGEEERKIGDLPYRYPLVTAERIRLWGREEALRPYPYYDPYYYPYFYPSWSHWPYWDARRPFLPWHLRPWPHWW